MTSESIVSSGLKASDSEWLLEYRRFHDHLMRSAEERVTAHGEPKRPSAMTPGSKKAA